MSRADELAASLAAVERRVAAACAAAGRPRDEVTVVAVTKTHPASDVRLLAGLGVREVGESREQEAAPKAAECAGLPLRWHFVGRLQSNKAAAVARWASVVHSVDRERLVPALDAGAQRAGRVLDCFVQVSLDEPGAGDDARGGARPADVPALADAVAAATALRLVGVMAVAPREGSPEEAFARLAATAAAVRRGHPGAGAVSAGMSGDLEQAVAAGATHLRIGTALLGKRPALR